MRNPIDIIRVQSDETLLWMEAADNLTDAKFRVRELILNSPGEYIVYDRETQRLVSLFSPRPSPPSADLGEFDRDHQQTISASLESCT